MRDNRRRLGTVGAAILGLLFLAAALGFMHIPSARAQTTVPPTYAITSPSSAVVTTTVAPTTTTKAPSGLAFTGADIGITMGAAAVALGVGGLLVMASRKRKATQ